MADTAVGPSPTSAGYALYAKGASNDWTVTYDEILVVTKGVFSVLVDGVATTARPGEMIFLPRGTTLTYRAEEAAEVIYVSYPHLAQATRASAHAKAIDHFSSPCRRSGDGKDLFYVRCSGSRPRETSRAAGPAPRTLSSRGRRRDVRRS